MIWDVQYESVTKVTEEAINLVRHLDLSNRPWENGWGPPQSETDPLEAHPYLFIQYRHKGKPSEKGPLYDFFKTVQIPGNDANVNMPSPDNKRYPNPVIINEYAWLWLNRDGSTTTLTDRVYDVVFGENLSTKERIYQYNRHLGMLTEYWRTQRYCAGVMHFCGLAYSRPNEPRGQTSDHFIDITKLIFEPQFEKYVKPAFAPVGLMINFWEKNIQAGENLNIEIYAINDLDSAWNGPLTLTINKMDEVISSQVQQIAIGALDKLITINPVKMPSSKGEYQLIAKINFMGESIKSIREFSVK